MEDGTAGGSGGVRGSVSRLNVLIAGTAAIIGIIYGYDLGSIASAILFLEPDLGLSTFMVSVVTATVVLGQLLGALGALGGPLTFGIFLALALLSLLFIYRLAPETKGRQLESIRQYWYNVGKWPEEAEARTVETRV